MWQDKDKETKDDVEKLRGQDQVSETDRRPPPSTNIVLEYKPPPSTPTVRGEYEHRPPPSTHTVRGEHKGDSGPPPSTLIACGDNPPTVTPAQVKDNIPPPSTSTVRGEKLPCSTPPQPPHHLNTQEYRGTHTPPCRTWSPHTTREEHPSTIPLDNNCSKSLSTPSLPTQLPHSPTVEITVACVNVGHVDNLGVDDHDRGAKLRDRVKFFDKLDRTVRVPEKTKIDLPVKRKARDDDEEPELTPRRKKRNTPVLTSNRKRSEKKIKIQNKNLISNHFLPLVVAVNQGGGAEVDHDGVDEELGGKSVAMPRAHASSWAGQSVVGKTTSSVKLEMIGQGELAVGNPSNTGVGEKSADWENISLGQRGNAQN